MYKIIEKLINFCQLINFKDFRAFVLFRGTKKYV